MKTTLLLSGFFCLLAANAYAGGGNSASFNHNDLVLASTLGATIAASHVDFQPFSGSSTNGNQIASNAFSGIVGVVAVNQNTGINAINQQAVTVKIDGLTLPPH